MKIKSNELDFQLEIKNKKFNLQFDNQKYTGHCIFGGEGIWVPYSRNVGLKIIQPTKSEWDRGNGIDNVNLAYNNLLELQKLDLDIFPKIYQVVTGTIDDDIPCTISLMENVIDDYIERISDQSWLPESDRHWAQRFIIAPLSVSNNCVRKFIDYELNPEDEWYKPNNLIGQKIIDFHRFDKLPGKYRFESDASKEEMQQVYNTALLRYSKIVAQNLVKWKGKIYEGFKFSNGYEMPGYSSDGKYYDSYIKLPFVPLNKSLNKNVLDLGSNQGFLSFQAAIHGAKMVTGVEITKEDVDLAEDINKNLLKLDNVQFIRGDAVDFVMNDTTKYGLIILSSTLHQLYPNFKGSEEFMTKIRDMGGHLFFETATNHPQMNISLESIYNNLKKYYQIVRLTYLYNAYSSGYRSIFTCFNL